jgi:hypothetical protein
MFQSMPTSQMVPSQGVFHPNSPINVFIPHTCYMFRPSQRSSLCEEKTKILKIPKGKHKFETDVMTWRVCSDIKCFVSALQARTRTVQARVSPRRVKWKSVIKSLPIVIKNYNSVTTHIYITYVADVSSGYSLPTRQCTQHINTR